MFPTFCLLIQVMLLVGSLSVDALAFAMPATIPLTDAVKGADTIAVVRLDQYTPDTDKLSPNDTIVDKTGVHKVYTGMAMEVFVSTLQGSGRYTFQVLQTLKGKAENKIQIHLPYILSTYYGHAKLELPTGSQFLLFLKATKIKGVMVEDGTVPLIPGRVLPASQVASAQDDNFFSKVVQSMLLSVGNAQNRAADTYLLRNVVDPAIVPALARYLDDPNENVRDNVLFCLATNQQVAAIPRIAALDAKLEAQGSGAQSTMALPNFQTSEAVPYLNPLLFSPAYYTRLNTVFAIDHLANRTTVPYLLLAVRDPDEQNIIPQSAYGLLHQLNPSLGEAFGNDYFAQHRAVETRKLFAWWSDELLGKHLKPGEHPAIPAELPNAPALLNPLLFVPDTVTRRAAAAKLARLGGTSSIPYLILALQDPDAQALDVNVSYVAYKTLHRLIPSLGAVQDSDSFTANHAAAVQPIYDWWRDELLGKHLPK